MFCVYILCSISSYHFCIMCIFICMHVQGSTENQFTDPVKILQFIQLYIYTGAVLGGFSGSQKLLRFLKIYFKPKILYNAHHEQRDSI